MSSSVTPWDFDQHLWSPRAQTAHAGSAWPGRGPGASNLVWLNKHMNGLVTRCRDGCLTGDAPGLPKQVLWRPANHLGVILNNSTVSLKKKASEAKRRAYLPEEWGEVRAGCALLWAGTCRRVGPRAGVLPQCTPCSCGAPPTGSPGQPCWRATRRRLASFCWPHPAGVFGYSKLRRARPPARRKRETRGR